MEHRHAMKSKPDQKPPSDMIQWIIDNSNAEDGKNVDHVSKTQMLISVVAIHTTSMTVSFSRHSCRIRHA